jgi:hypothetical protein
MRYSTMAFGEKPLCMMLSGTIFTVLIHFGLITLILRLAFAKPARHYFQGHEAAASDSANNSTV